MICCLGGVVSSSSMQHSPRNSRMVFSMTTSKRLRMQELIWELIRKLIRELIRKLMQWLSCYCMGMNGFWLQGRKELAEICAMSGIRPKQMCQRG